MLKFWLRTETQDATNRLKNNLKNGHHAEDFFLQDPSMNNMDLETQFIKKTRNLPAPKLRK